MSELPNGWTYCTIPELLGPEGIFIDGDWIESKDQDNLGEVRLIQLADLGDGYFLNKSNRFMTKETAEDLNCTFLEQGDILVARMPDPLGRSIIFPLTEKEKYVTVVDVAIIRLKNIYIDNQYFSHCINSPYIREIILALQTGTTRKRISRSNLSTINFPIAPLSEQIRIVEILEELLSRADRCSNDLRASLNKIKFYEQSLLKYSFSGKLSKLWRQNTNTIDSKNLIDSIEEDRNIKLLENQNEYEKNLKTWENKDANKPKSLKLKKIKKLSVLSEDIISKLPQLPAEWGWCPIDHIISFNANSLKAGPFGSALKKDSYIVDGPFKVYGQEQVISGDSLLGSYFISKEKYDELSACSIKPFDILVSLVGTVGKVLILPEDCQEGVINPRLIKISLNAKYYNPKFFKYYFESLFLKNLYSGQTHGATMDVLNLGIVEKLPFPLLSLEEQNEIVRELDAQFSAIEYLEKTIKSSLHKIEEAKKKLVHDAFKGRLTNPLTTDEPIKNNLKKNQDLRNEKLLERPKPVQRKRLMKKVEEKLIDILENAGGQMSAKELWLKSKHKDSIEDFYSELKEIQNKIVEIRNGSESLIAMRNENQ